MLINSEERDRLICTAWNSSIVEGIRIGEHRINQDWPTQPTAERSADASQPIRDSSRSWSDDCLHCELTNLTFTAEDQWTNAYDSL